MNRKLSINSIDKITCRLHSTFLIAIVALCVLVIYICNLVTVFSLASARKEVIISKHVNISARNSYNKIQNFSQNNNHVSRNKRDTEQQMQVRFDESKTKATSATEVIITTEQTEMPCLERSIIDTTRDEIAQEMKDFKFTNKMTKLSTLENDGKPRRNVILSTWRSGSSFFGDILNAIPGSYYFFEPLMHFGDIQLRDQSNLVEDAMKTFHQLLNCNFTNQDYYLEHAMQHYNTRLWKFCDAFSFSDLCGDQNFLSAFCSLFPIQTVKEVRLRPAFAEPLLMDANLNIKIVLLIRDPRGITSSRKREYWCYSGEECNNTENVCQDLISDYEAAQEFTEKYPDRFKVIRYEDLSLNPFKVTEEVLNFYGLPFHDSVKEFLDSHTSHDAGNSMSTFRNSKDAAFSWRHNMSFADVDEIQTQCTEAMDLWGYQKVMSEDDLTDDNFNPLIQFPFDIVYDAS